MLNLGRLWEICRACLEKKPLFLVENDGYPLISSLLAFAEDHVTPFDPGPPFVYTSEYPLRGEERPLMVSNGLVKPGLAHPPPALGDGDRDRDMSSLAGVPGIVGNDCARTRAVSPDAAPMLLVVADVCKIELGDDLTLEERRLRCVSWVFCKVAECDASLLGYMSSEGTMMSLPAKERTRLIESVR